MSRPITCAMCGKDVPKAAGLYRCACGWTPKHEEYHGRPFGPEPKYPPYESLEPEPVDSFFKRSGAKK